MKKQLSKMAALSAMLVMSTAAFADPVLTISDGVTSSGPITLTGGSGTYASGSFDGSWSVVVATGSSKPVSGSTQNPNIQLSITATSLGSAHNLQIILSDNNFGPTTGPVEASLVGHPFAGNGDAISYDTYYDAGNGLGALTTPISADDGIVPNGSNLYLSDKTSALALTAPYSLSQVVTINGSQVASYSLSANLQAANQTVGQPSLILVKTATPTNAAVGQPVTYSYAVTNTGNVTITNINIVDDNGTPGDASDDFYVNAAPFNLAAGQGTSFAISHITEPTCMQVSGSNVVTGSLTVNVLPTGDIEVIFDQSQNNNDNRYGTGATAATGWKNGHKFSDLTGSDEATFLFTDANGKQVLEFQADYISAATSTKFGDGVAISYPSGYGTLGPLGGDGKMLIGSSSNVLSVHTTLSDSINQPSFISGFTVNSPPETSPLSNMSIPPGWNYTNAYDVIVSKNAFGTAGFGGVTIPLVHNSPPKVVDKVIVTNVCSCVVNTATAFAVQGTTVIASAADTAQVCFGPQGSSGGGSTCSLVAGKVTVGAGGLTIPIKNTGTTTVLMTEVDLGAWPAANGNLTQINLNGSSAVWSGSVAAPAALTTTDFNATSVITTQRSIPPGKQFNLVLKFQHAANNTLSGYTGGVVKFGTDASCAISFP